MAGTDPELLRRYAVQGAWFGQEHSHAIEAGAALTDLEQEVERVLRRRLGITAAKPWLLTLIDWEPKADDVHRNAWDIADELEPACRAATK